MAYSPIWSSAWRSSRPDLTRISRSGREPVEPLETTLPHGYTVPVVLGLAFVSGGLVLSYEVLWTRELLNLLGSTTRASAITLAGFMAGIALGAWLGGRWTVRLRRPLYLYAVAEGLLAVFGVGLPLALRRVADIDLAVVFTTAGEMGSAIDPAFAILIGAILLPAFLMGIALPALVAALQSRGADSPAKVALVYGVNTLGAALGALAVGFGTIPMFGLAASQLGTVAVGAVAAAVAGTIAYTRADGSRPFVHGSRSASAPTLSPVQRRSLLAALFLSGFAALGYQILWTRILVLVVGSSTNAFALMLALYLIGLAIGAFWVGRYLHGRNVPTALFQFLQLGVAVTALAGLAMSGVLPDLALFGFGWVGSSSFGILAVSAAAAAVIILPPTILIGATLPLGARLIEGDVPRRGWELGIVLGATTAGNVVGVLGTALLLIPWLGLRGGIIALVLGNLAAAGLFWWVTRARDSRHRLVIPISLVVVAMSAPLLPSWDVKIMTSGVFRRAPTYLAVLGGTSGLKRAFATTRMMFYEEGSEAVVAVYDRPTLSGVPHRVLTIDGKVDASTGADMATQILSGYLPFLFRPNARRALVIGLASGVTVGALSRYPAKTIDVVEIEPAVVAAASKFNAISGAPLGKPGIALRIGDGRRYLARTRKRYDIIVSEPSNPWLSMSARLFTREFFMLARRRLSPGGVFVQWIPLYGLSARQFSALLRTLLRVFPDVALFHVAKGDLVAISGRTPLTLSPASLARLFEGAPAAELRRAGIESEADLIARYVADQKGLRRALGRGPLNTDDNGLLEFGSPWYLLADTIAANLAIVARAFDSSGYVGVVVDALLRREQGATLVANITKRHISDGRLPIARRFVQALQARNRMAEAALLFGDIAGAQGRWSKAAETWKQQKGDDFAIRLARLAYRTGDVEGAARLFAQVPGTKKSNQDALIHALSLAALARPGQALDVLETVPSKPISLGSIIGSYLKSVLLDAIGDSRRAAIERAVFDARLDRLRRCLETDRCRPIADALLRWGRASPPGLPAADWQGFRNRLYLRVTRPLPQYFRGVGKLWLGDYAAARRSFTTYLRLLPRPDGLSRVHALMKYAEARSIPLGKLRN